MALSLKQFNTYAAIVHFLTFVVVLVLYLSYKISRKKGKLNVYRPQLAGPIKDTVIPPVSPNTLSYCSTQGNVTVNPGRCQVQPSFQQPAKVGTFNVLLSCMAFFLVTAIAHALYAWDGYIPGLSISKDTGFYTSAVKFEGWNPYRWIEYGISASLMSAILATIQGSSDLNSVLLMTGVTCAMQFGGFTVESLMRNTIVDMFSGLQKTTIIGSTLGSWILFMFLWFCNLYSFFSLIIDVRNKYKGIKDPLTGKDIKIPSFVYFIVIVQLLNYALFGFVQMFQIVKNWNATSSSDLINFERIEKYYLMLSYAAKLGLAGGVSYGLILRTKPCKE